MPVSLWGHTLCPALWWVILYVWFLSEVTLTLWPCLALKVRSHFDHILSLQWWHISVWLFGKVTPLLLALCLSHTSALWWGHTLTTSGPLVRSTFWLFVTLCTLNPMLLGDAPLPPPPSQHWLTSDSLVRSNSRLLSLKEATWYGPSLSVTITGDLVIISPEPLKQQNCIRWAKFIITAVGHPLVMLAADVGFTWKRCKPMQSLLQPRLGTAGYSSGPGYWCRFYLWKMQACKIIFTSSPGNADNWCRFDKGKMPTCTIISALKPWHW